MDINISVLRKSHKKLEKLFALFWVRALSGRKLENLCKDILQQSVVFFEKQVYATH